MPAPARRRHIDHRTQRHRPPARQRRRGPHRPAAGPGPRMPDGLAARAPSCWPRGPPWRTRSAKDCGPASADGCRSTASPTWSARSARTPDCQACARTGCATPTPPGCAKPKPTPTTPRSKPSSDRPPSRPPPATSAPRPPRSPTSSTAPSTTDHGGRQVSRKGLIGLVGRWRRKLKLRQWVAVPGVGPDWFPKRSRCADLVRHPEGLRSFRTDLMFVLRAHRHCPFPAYLVCPSLPFASSGRRRNPAGTVRNDLIQRPVRIAVARVFLAGR